MAQQLRTYRGMPNSFTTGMTFTEPELFGSDGIYLGTSFDGRRLCINPWRPANSGGTKALTWAIFGDLGYWKSSLIKEIAIRARELPAGYDKDGNPLLDKHGDWLCVRERLHGRKNLKTGESEIAPVVNALGGKMYPLRSLRVTPFDPLFGFDEVDFVEIAIMFAEHVLGKTVTPLEALMLMIGVRRMVVHDSRTYSIPRLAHLVMTILDQDAIDYVNADNDVQRKEYEERFKDAPEILEKLAPSLDRTVDINDAEIRKARLEMGSALKRVQGGDYGKTFSGHDSLYEMCIEEVAGWDWLDLTPRATQVMELMQRKIHLTAHATGQDETVPMLSLSDEGQTAMLSPNFAALKAREHTVNRRFSQLQIDVAQYFQQMYGVGDEGSDLRNNAEIIRNTNSLTIVGHVPSKDKKGCEELRAMRVPEHYIKNGVNIYERGQFLMITGGHSYVEFSLDANEMVKPLLETEHARKTMYREASGLYLPGQLDQASAIAG